MQIIANSFAFIGVVSGMTGLFYMYKLYRIPARPFWNHWQTGTAFFGSMLSLGALIIAVVSVCALPLAAVEVQALLQTLMIIIALGLGLEGFGHIVHARDMQASGNEGAASYYRQVTQYGKSYILRNVLLGFSLLLATLMAINGFNPAHWAVANAVHAGKLRFWTFIILCTGYTNHHAGRFFLEK